MRYAMAFVAFSLMACAAGCHSGQVQATRTDDPTSVRDWCNKLDCTQYDEKTKSLGLSFSVKVAGGLVSAGPGISLSKSIGTKWNENVQKVTAIYKEVCGRFNSGLMSQQRVKDKMDKIDDLFALLDANTGFRDAVGEYWNNQANIAMQQLDAELNKSKQAEIEQALSKIEPGFAAFDKAFQAKAAEAMK
jgi:hypothetical protein